MVTSRRHGMRCWMRTTAAADGTLLTREVALLDGHRRLRRQRPARDGDRRPTRRPAPTASRRSTCEANCVYCNTPPSGSYRAFGATHLQWIGESQLDEVARRAGVDPLELRRRSLVLPGEPVRPDGSGKPLDADLVGDVERAADGGRLGRAAAAVGRPRRQRRAARRRRASRLARVGAAVLRRLGRRLRRHDRDGPGPADGDGADRRRGARPLERAGARPRRRHPLHPLRPLDRREPLDHDRRARRQACRRARSPSGCARPPASCGTSTRRSSSWSTAAPSFAGEEISLPRPDRQALRLPRRRDHRGRRGPPDRRRRPAPTPRARTSGRCASPAPRSRSIPTPASSRVLRTATVADVGKAINPQLVERQDEGATLQGIGNALFEEMRLVDGEVVNDNLLEYRVPRIADLPGRDDARSSSRTPTARALRRQGLRRGRVRRGARRRSSARSPTRACR